MGDELGGYAALVAVVFGVNLLPAFGPPTWAVLVFFRLNSDLVAVPLVLLGALAAASGRFALAHGARALRGRLSPERIEHLDAARDALTAGRRRSVAGLGLFALSPVPSAQLFVAAGLVGGAPPAAHPGLLLRAPGLLLAVRRGRDGGAGIAGRRAHGRAHVALGIAIQVTMLAALVVLLRVDWASRIAR